MPGVQGAHDDLDLGVVLHQLFHVSAFSTFWKRTFPHTSVSACLHFMTEKNFPHTSFLQTSVSRPRSRPYFSRTRSSLSNVRLTVDFHRAADTAECSCASA